LVDCRWLHVCAHGLSLIVKECSCAVLLSCIEKSVVVRSCNVVDVCESLIECGGD